MRNPESPSDKGERGGKVARLVTGVLILVVAAGALLLTAGLNADSAPQQTVQELRYIKWLIVGMIGLWFIRA